MTGHRYFALLLLVCAGGVGAQVFGPAVTINGVEIPRRTVQAQTDHLVNQRGLGSGGITQPSAYREIQEQVVEQLVVQELLWQEAQRVGIVADESEVDAALEEIKSGFSSDLEFGFKIKEGGYTESSFRENIRQQKSVRRMLVERVESGITVDEADVAAFYRQHIDEMQVPERVRARHILVKFDSADPASRADAERRLQDISDELDGGASFALLAIERSEGPSSARGGDLGYFGRGQMVKAFEDVAFALEPGEVSVPVETGFGLHLIRVEDHIDAGVAPLAEVAPKIRDHLAREAFYKAVEALVERLRTEGEVVVHLW